MRQHVASIAIGAAGLIGWLLLYAAARLLTRPASPRPAPATPDLGTEPPALVSLLVDRWELTEDAAESTLLDLAARRHIELRQPGDDPMQTTVHLTGSGSDPAGALLPYEKRVLDRVAGLAVGGVVPVTALTFRDDAKAKAWNKRLRAEVVRDARARGLSRRRFGPAVNAILITGAVLAGAVLAFAVGRYTTASADPDDDGLIFGAFLFSVLIMCGIAGRYPGERDTAAGREAAARWLGLRDWLRGHDEFANLPPASTAVWDRYLAYGAATGVTRVASAVLDLGMGDRTRVWSSFGGTWHRVRVRYPRFWPRYGLAGGQLTTRILFELGFGVLLLWLTARLRGWLTGLDPAFAPDRPFDLGERIAFLAGVVLVAHGAYRLLRLIVDVAAPRTITGEVLWVQVWRTASAGEDSPSVPWLYHLAIDDGTADRTVAWGLPAKFHREVHDGDLVTIVVRRWTRRIGGVTVVEPGGARRLAESTANVTMEKLIERRDSRSPAARGEDVTGLLTAEEVGQALGMPVQGPQPLPTPAPFAMTFFTQPGRNRQVLMVGLGRGMLAQMAWRRHTAKGTPLPGIGEAAYVSGDQAALRVGERILVLTLMDDARGRGTYLPWLLTRAAQRLGAGSPAPPAGTPTAPGGS